MKTNQFLLLSFVSLSFFVNTATAQTVPLGEKKKLTLGDLIKKVKEDSRVSKLSKVQKNSVVVPDTAAIFEEKKNVNLVSVKPPRMNEIYQYENRDKAEYEKTLNLQINELYKMTQKFKTSSNRGELWLRLAELYVEKANIVDTRRQNEYDQKLAEFQAGKGPKPVLDLAEAKEYNRKAIQLYDWFLKDFPTDPKVPQALFFLGYNNFELGNVQQGTSYYEQLTNKYPTSNFSGEAHFAMGESLFDGEKWVNAYKEYSYLIKDNKHNLHIVGLYKAAWCLYRLGKTEEGIKYLDYIVRSGRRAKLMANNTGKKVNSARLETESLKDLVVFFADVGDTKRAINYFTGLNFKGSRDYIERLAYYMSDKGNRESSKDIFKYLIALEPTAKKAFEYQYQIVQNYFFSKNSPEFRLELYRWIITYNEKSAWYAANKSDTVFAEKSNQLREQTLRNYVLQQHQTAQNSRAEASRAAAEQGYRLYFQEFTKSPQAPDMHFYYGELLYDMQKYAEAANEYQAVITDGPTSQFAEKSSQNLLLAIERVLPKDEDLQKRIGTSTAAVPLDPISEKFVKAANYNLEKFPKSENAGEIRFRVARLYYLTNNFDQAEKYFKDVVKLHPKTKISEYSANLLLDIYNLKNDYVGLEKMGAELLANESIASSKAGADIRAVLEKSSFKRAQNLEIEKKYLESATQFQLFAAQNPKSDLVGVAFFNAGVNFERAGKVKDAVFNYKRLIASNDKSIGKFKPQAKKLLAKLYQESGMFEESGNLFAEMVHEDPKGPMASNYQFNSALMLELSGKTNAAIKEYTKYIATNSNKQENAQVIFKIASIKRREKNLKESLEYYRQYLELPAAKVDKKIEALYWIYDISLKTRQKVDLAATEAKMKSLLGRVPEKDRSEVNSFLARIKLDEALQTFEKLKAIKVPANPAKQKAAVDQKLEIINSLNDQLGRVIKLDSAEQIVSALYVLGEANEHMAQSFLAVPVPANLNEANKKLYQDEIQKIIAPFQSKAEESYKLSVERALELQVYSDDYRKAFAKMSTKFPQVYYNAGEVSYEIKSIDWMVQ